MKIFKDLEFDIILQQIASMSSSDVVAAAILNTKPTDELDVANKLLTQTGDAITVLASHRPSLYFDDVEPLIAKARVGAVLSPKELLSIKSSINALRSLKTAVECTDGVDSLKDITAYVGLCEELEYAIERAIENETDLKDSASERLAILRKSIIKASARLKDKLDSYTRLSDISKFLRDNIVTMRGGRYVLPVRSDCRSNVKGLVHDVSSTGATVFIEPFAVVEANNEIITLKNEEQNEIERILADLSKSVVSNATELVIGQHVLVECGVIFAKAEYSKRQNAYRPSINDSGRINLKGARHPLIDSSVVVPVDISLDDKRVLLISGPNTGGKTVALKTVGLFSLFSACGIFLPANDGSEISLFSDIYCDIGDSQSIAQSLSTFSAHIANLSAITSAMNDKSLVLLDEPGDGTDPEEGAALAIAVIKKILRESATAVVTTHFNSVKEFAIACNGISNACMQFDNVNFRPTYKLIRGVSGSSYALEIAEKLGLSQDIIEDAHNALSAEKVVFDKILREAENLRNQSLADKAEWERLRMQAKEDAERTEKIKRDYERKLADISNNATAMVKRLADDYSDRADDIIEQLKDLLKNANETALFEARKIAKKLQRDIPSDEIKPHTSDAPPDPSELTVGTAVFVSGLNKEGIITAAPRGNKVVVAIGSIKTDVPVSSLLLIKQKQVKKARSEGSSHRESENREIMLLGKTVDEATYQIDLVLADIAPQSTLRIVHGKGTGALGKGIQAYLRRQPRVKSFRYGRYGEGDTGVTIVEIK